MHTRIPKHYDPGNDRAEMAQANEGAEAFFLNC